MSKPEIINARIVSTFLGLEDHGIPTCSVGMDYGSAGQSFGGYDLRHYGSGMLTGILEAVGAPSWEELVGMNCRVYASHDKVHAIGHIVEDRWYSPKGVTP